MRLTSPAARSVSCLAKVAAWCPHCGNGGQLEGGGVFGSATNLSTVSLRAVEGGFPVALAGALAHQAI